VERTYQRDNRSIRPESGFRNSIRLRAFSFSGKMIRFVPEIPGTAVGIRKPSEARNGDAARFDRQPRPALPRAVVVRPG
jgi:hypothetical protein